MVSLRHLLGSALLLTFSAGAASAQFFDRPWGAPPPFRYNAPPPPYPYGYGPVGRAAPLLPSEIVERLDDQGYDEIGVPRSNGRAYVVEATTPRGRRVTLLVDPYGGRVIDRLGAGDPRSREEADFGPGPTPRREAPRPARVVPPAAAPEQTPGAAPADPRPAGRARLQPPADARVAPDPSAGPVPETKPEPKRPPREAARPAGEKPFGTNPGAPVRRKTEEPRTTSPVSRPDGAPAPTAASAPTAATATTPARPRGPVRVIEGVTTVAPAPGPSEPPASPPSAPTAPE